MKSVNLETNLKILYTLEKISDDKFNGNHPEGVSEGYIRKSSIISNLEIGQSFYIGSLGTSVIKEIVSSKEGEVIFKTLNSTYKLTWEKK